MERKLSCVSPSRDVLLALCLPPSHVYNLLWCSSMSTKAQGWANQLFVSLDLPHTCSSQLHDQGRAEGEVKLRGVNRLVQVDVLWCTLGRHQKGHQNAALEVVQAAGSGVILSRAYSCAHTSSHLAVQSEVSARLCFSTSCQKDPWQVRGVPLAV